MAKIDDLRKETQELQKQASIKKTLYENDMRYGEPTLIKIEKLTAKILENEERIKKLKDFDRTGERLSLEKQIEKLQKSGLNSMKKELNLSSELEALQKSAASGDKEQIKSAKKYTKLLDDINAGNKDISEVLNTIATEDFGKFNKNAEILGEMLSEYPGIMEDLGKERKFADMIDQVQDALGMVDLKKTFTFAGALAAVVSLAKETAQIRQDLGLSVGESANLATKTTILSKAFSLIGGDGEQIAAFSKAIASEFGSINELSFKTLTNFGLLQLRTGITGDNAAKLAKSIQSIQGGSLETSLNMISTFESMSRAAGVAPKLVLDDVAESTELFAKFAKDGGENLAKAAIEARKLGLNLSAVDKISESILDFETSIEKQMEASVLLGRQLNLDKARELALSGDLEGVLAEVKNQVGGTEALNRMNVVQRKALADAVGLEVSELSKLAAGQENVNKLSNGQMLSLGKTFAITAGIVTVLSGAVAFLVSMMPGGKLRLLRGIVGGRRGLKFGAKAGLAAGSMTTGIHAMMPKAQTGGVVRETGMAVVHKGETIAGTQFGGRESNKLLKQMIEQNATLMNRLTNRVGDLALSS
jgi:hypothetical protein